MSCQGCFWVIHFFWLPLLIECFGVCLQLRDTCLVFVTRCEKRLWIKWREKVKMKGESESWVRIVYHHSLCWSDLQVTRLKNNDGWHFKKTTQTSVRFEQVGWFSFCACLNHVLDLEISAFLWIIQCYPFLHLERVRGSDSGEVLMLYCMHISKQHTRWWLLTLCWSLIIVIESRVV